MFDHGETLDWSELVYPYGQAERALGHLAQALETTRLHQTWLWREMVRASAAIAQAGGYQASVDQLQRLLIGAPGDPDDMISGPAAARRVFLIAAPIFRKTLKTDSISPLWPAFWARDPSDGRGGLSKSDDEPTLEREGEGDRQQERLAGLVREIAGAAEGGRRPVLIDLFIDLRRRAATKRLSPHLLRLALPLALAETGLVPKAAPGLLGGRRLALGMSRASPEARPLSDWLKRGLDDLALEARQSRRRLAELTSQYQAWHGALAAAGLRRHARAPQALDLLSATPILSISLVAAHLGCTHVAAGKIMERLVETGILIAATSRSRHKIFVAGDLPTTARGEVDIDQTLIVSEPARLVDVDALDATLDGLFADLDRLNDRRISRSGWRRSDSGLSRLGE